MFLTGTKELLRKLQLAVLLRHVSFNIRKQTNNRQTDSTHEVALKYKQYQHYIKHHALSGTDESSADCSNARTRLSTRRRRLEHGNVGHPEFLEGIWSQILCAPIT